MDQLYKPTVNQIVATYQRASSNSINRQPGNIRLIFFPFLFVQHVHQCFRDCVCFVFWYRAAAGKEGLCVSRGHWHRDPPLLKIDLTLCFTCILKFFGILGARVCSCREIRKPLYIILLLNIHRNRVGGEAYGEAYFLSLSGRRCTVLCIKDVSCSKNRISSDFPAVSQNR